MKRLYQEAFDSKAFDDEYLHFRGFLAKYKPEVREKFEEMSLDEFWQLQNDGKGLKDQDRIDYPTNCKEEVWWLQGKGQLKLVDVIVFDKWLATQPQGTKEKVLKDLILPDHLSHIKPVLLK